VTTWPVVGGTGHRTHHLTPAQRDWSRVQAVRCLRHCRDQYGTHTVVSGLALGWDTWIAEAALVLRMKLWVHIPFPQQPDRWPDRVDRATWARLRAAATQEKVYGYRPSVGLLHKRNDGMIEVSSAMLALWLPSKITGGTASAIGKIAEARKPWVHLDPAAQVIESPNQCVHAAVLLAADEAQDALPI
jgi:hypothetical protein